MFTTDDYPLVPPCTVNLSEPGTSQVLCAIVQSMPHAALVFTSTNTRVVLWNMAASELFGLSINQVSGRCLETVLPELDSFWRGNHNEVFGWKEKRFKAVFSPLRLSDADGDLTLCILNNITRSEELREQLDNKTKELTHKNRRLQKRLDFEKIVNGISSGFFNTPLDRLDNSIIEALATGGTFLEAHWACIVQFTEDFSSMHKDYIWRYPDVNHLYQDPKVDLTEYHWLREELRAQKIVVVSQPYDVPVFARAENDCMAKLNIASLVLVPYTVDGLTNYGMYMGTYQNARQWTESDVSMVTTLGRTIMGAIARKKSEGSLAQTKEIAELSRLAAEAASQAKTTFLANISHEIRTPMNAILGYTKVLSKLLHDDEEREYVQIIQVAGQNLLNLLNELLDLSKIEAGRMNLDLSPVSVTSVLKDIVNLYQLKASEKNLELLLDVADTTPAVLMLDQHKLRQIVSNLVSNAVKFTLRGRIKLQAEAVVQGNGNHTLKLVVSDTGIGIPQNMQQKVFEAFTQYEADGVNYGGSGLGLTIIKKLVELMNGRITLHSQPGQGSSFTVTLPDVVEGEKACVSEVEPLKIKTNLSGKVLVCEDNALNRKLLVTLFKRSGLEVEEACNGQQAVELARTLVPDLIIMDMHMPVLDGLEATRMIRQFAAKVRIIALTADTDAEVSLMQAGCNLVLIKPVDMDTMLQNAALLLQSEISEQAAQTMEQSTALGVFLHEKIPQFKDLSRGMIIDKWEDFGYLINKEAIAGNDVQLAEWAQQLANAARDFNINRLKELIGRFDDHLKRYQRQG